MTKTAKAAARKGAARTSSAGKAAATPPRRAKGRATPSERLTAAREACEEVIQAVRMPISAAMTLRPTAMKVRTKFVVVEKTEVPVVGAIDMSTNWQVKLAAAYEARSIRHGQATCQGNADNRIFGDGLPEAVIVMTIQSKAIADTFRTGRAFSVDFTELPAEG